MDNFDNDTSSLERQIAEEAAYNKGREDGAARCMELAMERWSVWHSEAMMWEGKGQREFALRADVKAAQYAVLAQSIRREFGLEDCG